MVRSNRRIRFYPSSEFGKGHADEPGLRYLGIYNRPGMPFIAIAEGLEQAGMRARGRKSVGIYLLGMRMKLP